MQQVLTSIIYDKRGRILSIGKNSYVVTHPLQAHYAKKAGQPHKIYLHSEIAALIKCKDLTKAHKIAIFRYNKAGKPMLAKPCPVCEMAIKDAGIKLITYTTGEEFES